MEVFKVMREKKREAKEGRDTRWVDRQSGSGSIDYETRSLRVRGRLGPTHNLHHARSTTHDRATTVDPGYSFLPDQPIFLGAVYSVNGL
jgi:hypothetical protein